MRFGCLVFVLAAVWGCSSDGDKTSGVDCKTSAGVSEKIFQPKCSSGGCHSAADLPDLFSPGVESRVVGVAAAAPCNDKTLVVPGNPDASYLYHKLADTKPSCGSRMPMSMPALTADELACVRDWIAAMPGGSTTDAGGTTDTGGGDTGTSCSTGLTACGGKCVDTKSDVTNCGGCGKACPSGQVCAAGACSSSCPTGTTNCSGSCVDTKTSAANCGSCGKACATGETCSGGTCACPTGQTSCGGKCVDTKTDAANCGGCGKACPTGQVCSAGTCSCGTTVSFSKDVQPVFTSTCATAVCHSGVVPKGNLNLSAGKSYAELVNVKATGVGCTTRTLVVPSSVASSYLINKLTGVDICGSQMPKTGGLGAGDFDKIRSWICTGAKND